MQLKILVIGQIYIKLVWSDSPAARKDRNIALYLQSLQEGSWRKWTHHFVEGFVWTFVTKIMNDMVGSEFWSRRACVRHPWWRTKRSWPLFSPTFFLLLPHSALSCKFKSNLNLESLNLQDRATKWHYYGPSQPPTPPPHHPPQSPMFDFL